MPGGPEALLAFRCLLLWLCRPERTTSALVIFYVFFSLSVGRLLVACL